jgi:peptidoglycan/LPS O-acetylase OafA/YrhL
MAFYLFFGLGLLPVVGRYIFFTWVALVLILWLPAGFYLVNPPFLEVIMKQAADGPVTRLFFDALDELFFFGMLAGLLYRRLSFTRRLSWGLLLAAAVLLTGDITIGGFGFGYGSLRAFVLGGTGFGALMLGLAGLEETGVLRLGSLCRALGKLSYPLYVIHDPAISLTFYLTARFPSQGAAGPLHAFVMMLALTFIGTLILTYLIDQPLQNFLRGLTFSNGIRGRATPANK